MDSERKEFTFVWFIENYSYCWDDLVSPQFTADGLEGTAWTIRLNPRGSRYEDKDHVSLFLNRSAEDDGPKSGSVKYELSFLAADGSPLTSAECDYSFCRGGGYGFSKILRNEILMRRKADYLPQDILTVRCKIWKGEGNVRNIGQCSARTRIKVVKNSFLHEVERFSTLQPNVKQMIKIRSHSKPKRFISSSLYCTEGCGEKIIMEIEPLAFSQILRKCELYLLDGSGNEVECGKVDNRYDTVDKIIRALPLSFTREEVLNRKSEYLPDDKLSLLCECTFYSGLEFQAIEEIQHGISRVATKRAGYQMPRKTDDKTVETTSAYPSALEDIKALYMNQSFTDVHLKTKTKSFSAHKVVLYARSPMFQRMLTSDMKEKNTNCIQVDDLQDDVVQQLLLFLYSDTVENLQWFMATQLYYAADKYQVGKLKKVCSSFLVENLTPTDASELLLLADTHSDPDLKKAVEDFILENDREVFGSKEWEVLMETNPVLAMKAMHLKYKRKKTVNE